MCAGRRGRKRKGEAYVEKGVVEQPAADEAGEAEGGQDGQKVVIEYWYVCHGSSWVTRSSNLTTLMHCDTTVWLHWKSDGSPKANYLPRFATPFQTHVLIIGECMK